MELKEFISKNKVFSSLVAVFILFSTVVCYYAYIYPDIYSLDRNPQSYITNFKVEDKENTIILNWNVVDARNIKKVNLKLNDKVIADVTDVQKYELVIDELDFTKDITNYELDIVLRDNSHISYKSKLELGELFNPEFSYKVIEGLEFGKGIELTLSYYYNNDNEFEAGKLAYPTIRMSSHDNKYFSVIYLENSFEDKGMYSEGIVKYFVPVSNFSDNDYGFEVEYKFNQINKLLNYTFNVTVKNA